MRSPKIKVALIQPVIPVYRVALFEYLSQFENIEITCFHSRGSKYGAKDVGKDLAVKNEIVPALYLPFRAAPAYQCVIKRVARGSFDVVVCTQGINNIATLLLWQLRKIFNYKFVWWGIGFDPYRQKDPYSKPEKFVNKLIVRLKDFVWKRSDSLLVYSEEGKRYSIDRKIPQEKIFTLNNTVHVEKMWQEAKSIQDDDIQECKKQLGLTGSSFIFLFVGRLHNRKEVPFLIEAFSRVTDELKNAKLIIVGDGEERQKVQGLIKTLGLEQQVILLGAIYDHRRLAELFLASDAVTLPGQVGLTVMHSFVYGKPVITKKSDSYSPELEYLKHGINGIKLADNQLESYAKAMKEIYLDVGLRDMLSDGAYKTAKKATMRNMAESFRKGIVCAVQGK